MNRNKLWLFIMPLGLVLNACDSDDDEGSQFKDQVLQGTINGKAWTYDFGSASAPRITKEIYIEMFGEEEESESACTPFQSKYPFASFHVPNEIGEHDLFLNEEDFLNSRKVIFFDPSENIVIDAMDGTIEILTVTETEVTGRMNVWADDETRINGNFTAPICP